MNISGISGVNFEGTGVKKARREENAAARENFVTNSIMTEGQVAPRVGEIKAPSLTVPVATLMGLLAIAAPSVVNPQPVIAQAGTSAQTTVPGLPESLQPAIIVQQGDRIPEPKNYINKWVVFKDGDVYSGIKVYNSEDKTDKFYGIMYYMFDEDGLYIGSVNEFDLMSGHFICQNKDGLMHVDARTYSDTKQALSYIEKAYADNLNRSHVRRTR